MKKYCTPLLSSVWNKTHFLLPYDILTPPAYLLIRNEGGQNTMGVQFTIQGGGSFNKGGQYTMDEN